jgi:hypothetical protein
LPGTAPRQNRRLLSAVFVLFALWGLASCLQRQGSTDPPARTESAAPSPSTTESRLTDKVWLVTAPAGRAPGSLYIFLADGTLMMTSCVETYRLATWHLQGDDRLLVTEDPTTGYIARVMDVSERDLRLRLELVGENVYLELRAADAPIVCPDLPR